MNKWRNPNDLSAVGVAVAALGLLTLAVVVLVTPAPVVVERTCLAPESIDHVTRVTVADRVPVDLYCGDRYVVRGGRCGIERVGAARVEVPCLRPDDAAGHVVGKEVVA